VLADWPVPVAADHVLQWRGVAAGESLTVIDTVSGLRAEASGGLARVLVDSSDLVVQGHYRGDRLIVPWLTHLLAQVSIGGMTTVVVGKVGTVTLKPLSTEQAMSHLQPLADAWREGLRRPLPLAARAAFEWLRLLPPGGGADVSKAREAARKAYEGGYQQLGEVQRSIYLQRVYPTFDALSASGEFAAWAESLLRPLQQATFAASERQGNIPREEGV